MLLTCGPGRVLTKHSPRAGREAAGALSGRRKVAGPGACVGTDFGQNSDRKLEAYCGEIA